MKEVSIESIRVSLVNYQRVVIAERGAEPVGTSRLPQWLRAISAASAG